MINQWAGIEITRKKFVFMGETQYFDFYEWKGSKYGATWIYPDRRTKELPMLPWPVHILTKPGENLRDSYEIIRKDVGWHIWWRLVALKRKLFHNRPYQHFKWRVIMTFDLWGLGYQPEGEVTSWKNIWRKREQRKMD